MKEVPSLKSDFKWPKLGLRLVKQLPMLFFGGTNSKVFMHLILIILIYYISILMEKSNVCYFTRPNKIYV
ncbi:Uncharacterised protein [Myroides odoratimimus]|nr:Uncharacterised protein [Myroides odoratimimus]